MRRRRARTLCTVAALATAMASVVVASACAGDGQGGGTAGTDERVRVGVALYPLEEVVDRVGGDLVEIVNITPPGVNSHDVELSARTLDQLAAADLVLYLGAGFQPRVEDSIDRLPRSVRTIDMLGLDGLSMPPESTGNHSHVGDDPHVWLDPANMIVMTRAVASALIAEFPDDPAASASVSTNADAYVAELTTLGDEVDDGLGVCASSTVITSHEAFGHLFGRLGLDHVSITGLDPAGQPSARELREIADLAREAGTTTVFVDAAVSTRFAETIAAEVGASVAVLDPIESLSTEALDAGATYASLQRANLRALAQGLGCR